MEIVEALPGEIVTDTLKRASLRAAYLGMCVEAVHNDTRINVYPKSYLYDLSEKFSLQRLFNRMCNERDTNGR